MTGVTWSIYSEHLKKERARLEAARNKAKKRPERIRQRQDDASSPAIERTEEFFERAG